MILRSIKWRLQAWHALMLIVVLAGFGFTAYQFNRVSRFQRIDRELRQRAEVVLRAWREPPGARARPLRGAGDQPPHEAVRGEFPPPRHEDPQAGGDRPERRLRLGLQDQSLFGSNTGGADYYYGFFQHDGRLIAKSDSAPDELAVPVRDGTNHVVRLRGNMRELVTYAPPGEVVISGLDAGAELAELRHFGWLLFGAGSGVLSLGLAGGWWMATRAIRPIADISAAATKISAGDLSQRIPAADAENELGQLAAVLNATFARLEEAFARQKQFTADAAHELRTPLSVILAQTQGTLTKERSPAEYRETLEACQRAAQRMRRLTESLLELARLDGGEEAMERTRFDLSATVRVCVEMMRPLARASQIGLEADLVPIECQGNADHMALVITNLLSNAVNFNHFGGEIRITTHREGGAAILTVTDSGPGIDAVDLPRIFDRFYRADSARTTTQGRSGLGLAISKLIVESHGGSIEARSHPGAGATFLVRLPAS